MTATASNSSDRRRGQDRAALDGRGFPVTLLPGRGIVRSCARRRRRPQLASPWSSWLPPSPLGLVASRARPRVVVSVGGYASVPAALAAVVLGVPLVLVNVDAVPGAANRLFGRFARASAVGWDGTALPRAVVTGTAVRPEIAAVRRGPDDRRRARREPRPPAGPAHHGCLRGIARGPPGQPGGDRADPAMVRSWRPVRLPRRGPAGLGGDGDGPRPGHRLRRRGPRHRPGALPGADGDGLRRRRRGGVPGRSHDRGRAGRRRRALDPGAAARCTGRPPDGQRSGPGTGRGRRRPRRRRLRR